MLMKKLLTFLTLLVLAYGVGWAAENDVHDAGISFSQLLNNNASINPVSISAPTYPIKTVTINWRYNKSTANVVTIEVKVGGTSWGTQSVGTNTTSDVIFNGTPTIGAVEITFTNNAGSGTGKGTFYVNSVSLTEGASSTVTKYDATAETGLSNGSISVSPDSAAEGTTVTVTGTPTSDAYYMSAVTVTPEGGTAFAATIDSSDPKKATFTMPAANVTVSATFTAKPTYAVSVTGGNASPSSAYEGQTVTLSPTISDGKVIDWDATTVSPSSVTIDHSDYTFTMPGEDVTVTFAFKDAPSYIFYESWNGTSGTGGNDNAWSGSIASSTLTPDNTGWTVENAGGASACAKFGTGSKKGLATTPSITVTSGSTYKLTFKAAAWNTSSESTSLPISATGATLYSDATCATSISSVSLTKGAWTEYTVYVKATSSSLTITWQGNLASNSRFFLDEVMLEPVATAATYTVTATASPAGAGTFSFNPAAAGTVGVEAGETVVVTATPAAGYAFGSWSYTSGITSSDVVEDGAETAFDMPSGNVELSASFNKVKYNILRTITTNGESSTAGGWLGSWTGWADEPNATDATGYTVNAYYGSTVTFKAGTNSGYQVGTVTATAGGSPVTLTVVSSDNTGTVYSFTMPASAVTITANFVTYHPTVKLGGLVNGDTWISDAADGVALTYDSTADKYTGRVFFTGNRDESGTCDYFFVFEDATAKYPSASGNYWITSVDGTAMTISLTGGSSNNFRIEPGIYDIELNGGRTSLKVTKVTPTLTFSPASGASVETGSTASVSSDLTSLIAAIDANATVTVGVAEAADASTWASSYTFVVGDVSSKTLYGKAYIGNIAVTGSATYTVTKASTSNQYQLATTLTAGKKYIIVSEGYNAGFTTGGNAESITINDHVTTLANGSGVIVFTLGGSSGAYTFATSDGKYLQWTSSTTVNAAGTDATDTKAQWDLSISDGTIVNVSSGRYLQYNDGATGNKFRAYAEANQTAVQLYEQVEAGDYTITYETVTGGTLSGRADANEGDVITVTATADTGYACTSISVDPSAAVTDNHDGTYTFTMPAANVTVTPTWAEAIAISYVNKYLDNNGENPTEGDAGGTVTGPSSAVEGAPVNVTVTPDDAYQLQSLTYAWNNGSGSADITEGKTFLMPATPTTVTAVFEKKPFSITVVSANGQVTGVPATAVSGQTVSFTVTPVAGYTITNVFCTWVDGEQEGSVTVDSSNAPTYSFEMPAHDVTVRVGYFAGDEYELLTDINDIVEGETYLIVGGAANSAPTPSHVMGTTLSSGYYNAIALVDGTNYNTGGQGYIQSSSSMSVVTFVKGTGDNADKWAIHTGDGYIGASGTNVTNSSTAAYMSITLGDNSRATIELGSNQLSFNNSSPRFKFYSGPQGATYIYKLANSNKVKKPTISGAAGQHIGLYNFIGTDQVTLACATDGATIEYKIGDATEWTTYSGEAFALPQTALGGTVTVTAKATKDEMDDSDEVSAVFTCVKPDWHTKPCGDNWNCTDQEYDSPVFIYPIASLDVRNAYGRANTRFFYTLDGTTPTMASAEVPTPSSGEKFLFLDENVTLSIIPVINDIAGDPVSGVITFVPAAPTTTLVAGSYDGDQQTRLSTTTKEKISNTTWTTRIYYAIESTTLGTPAAFAFDASTGEATSTGWTLYDPTTAPYIDIKVENGDLQYLHAVTLTNFYGGEFTGQYSGASVNLNSTGTWKKSAETQVEYQLTAANLDVVFSPAGGTYLYTKEVTLTPQNSIGAVTMTYDITWANPDAEHVNATGVSYNGAITVDQDATITVNASDSRLGEGGTYTKTHEYKIGVQEPLYSPYPGDYVKDGVYKYGDYYVLPSSGTSTLDVEIFDVSPNARIYYTYTKTTTDDAEYNGTKPYPEPAAPTRTTGTLYSGPITIEQGYTYVFSAIAYVGDLASPVRTRAFTVRTNTDSGDYWYSVKEMNEDNSGVTKTFANPVQVIWMSTHRNDGVTPEYCFISDNSGYGMVFFRSSSDAPAAYQSYTKFKQGDWLPGKSVTGKTAVWSSHYINELGGGSGTGANVTAWPSAAMNSRPITPEAASCKAIRDGWTYGNGTPTSYSGKDYKSYVDEEKNLFGHYVHLRKNTITQVTGDGAGNGKHTGIITGEHGTPLQYYDGFYLFSGYNTDEDYDQTFFNSVQNLGGTFDVYAVVQFYGTNTTNATYSYAPFEVFPIAFDWIFPPIFHLEGDASASDMTNDHPERTIHAPSTVTLTCDTRGAIMWYKTSDMEDYEVYEGQAIPVTKSMEISTYSIHSTEHFDQLESKVRTLTINMGDIEQPLISPESQVNPEGSEAITVSITCATEDATIWYTLDGSDPDDEANAARLEYTAPFEVSQTTTVRAVASAMDGDEVFYGMEAEQKTYTFVKSNGIVYDLVTSASQLKEGSIYVIVSKANHMAMKRTQKADNRDGAGVAFVDDATKAQVYGNDDLAMFTLHQYGSTGDWILHTANGSDNASIGYIYGNVSGTTNQLRTQFSNSSNEGKFEASIVIGGADSDKDKAYTATISFPAASGGERWLRYNKQYGLFNTYSSTTGEPVFLYKKDAFPLANIEVTGKLNTDYTIADELIGVHAVGTKLYAKDQGNVSIIKTENTGGWIDYVAELEGRTEEWDQSNWVCLDFSDYGADGETYAGSFEGHLIPPASLTGTFTDDLNYTLLVKNAPSVTPGAAETYSLNVLNPANFNTAYLNQGEAGVEMPNGRKFWFVNPKVQEVVEIHNAVWDGDKFVVPARQDKEGNTSGDVYYSINGNGFEGGFTVDLSMNNGVTSTSNLTPGNTSNFLAIVTRTDWNYGRERAAVNQSASPAPRRIAPGAGTASSSISVMPLNLTGGTITEVKDLPDTVKEVKAVRYIDVIGRVSEQPFEGVNIVVTEYTDGTTSTRKVLK